MADDASTNDGRPESAADEDAGSTRQADEDLDKRARELEQRERGLEDMADELDRRADDLDDREAELREFRAELEDRETELDEREGHIAELEAELDDREVAIEERERELTERADELAAKEETLQEYVNDSVAESVEDAVSGVLEGYRSASRLGTIGSLVLGLVGVTLIVGGVLNGFADQIEAVPILFASDAANLGVTVFLLFGGLAANLAAVAD